MLAFEMPSVVFVYNELKRTFFFAWRPSVVKPTMGTSIGVEAVPRAQREQDCRRRRRRQGRIRATHACTELIVSLLRARLPTGAQVVVLCLGTTSQNDGGNAVAHEGTDRRGLRIRPRAARRARGGGAFDSFQNSQRLATEQQA